MVMALAEQIERGPRTFEQVVRAEHTEVQQLRAALRRHHEPSRLREIDPSAERLRALTAQLAASR